MVAAVAAAAVMLVIKSEFKKINFIKLTRLELLAFQHAQRNYMVQNVKMIFQNANFRQSNLMIWYKIFSIDLINNLQKLYI